MIGKRAFDHPMGDSFDLHVVELNIDVCSDLDVVEWSADGYLDFKKESGF